MQARGVFDAVPLWALYLMTAGVVLLAVEAGWRLGNFNRQRRESEKEAPVGAVVGATLGLLAFLLAFTFGMAASRYDTRKQVVLQEANAIGTTYLRADLLPAPARDEVRSLLREYTALRAGGVASIMTPEGMSASATLQDKLWAVAASVGGNPGSIATGLFIESLNETIDLDTVRVAANRNQIPDSIWFVLYVVTILTMAAMGYQFGLSGVRSWAVTILLVLVFNAVILLIADLDRPQRGMVQVSQQALIDLLHKIGTPPP